MHSTQLSRHIYYNCLNISYLSDTLGKKLSKAWEKEVEEKRKKKKEPSLFKATMSVFGLNFGLLGLVLFIVEMGFR